jgi:Arc/MetJ-type ribon-helix-helix transcriptional regulator
MNDNNESSKKTSKSQMVFPRFSAEEIKKIDRMIERGYGKNRSDFVRMATICYLRDLE